MRPSHAPWAALALVVVAGCASQQHPRLAGAYAFQCTPADAHVVLDEEDQGVCALWADRFLGVTEGAHRLRVVRDGYLPYEQDVAPDGHRHVIRVQLRSVPE